MSWPGAAADAALPVEQAHADLLAAYEKRPHAALARMIEQLEAEIAARKSGAAKAPPGQDKSAA